MMTTILLILTSAFTLVGGLLIGMKITDIQMQEDIFYLKQALDDRDEDWAYYCQELLDTLEMNSKFEKIKSYHER